MEQPSEQMEQVRDQPGEIPSPTPAAGNEQHCDDNEPEGDRSREAEQDRSQLRSSLTGRRSWRTTSGPGPPYFSEDGTCPGALRPISFNHMIERLDDTYHALSHPLRRAVLHDLSAGPERVTDLAEPFDVSLAAVSKHIAVLERARLVTRTINGRDHFLALQTRPLALAREWIERTFWEGRLDALERELRRR